MWKGYYGKEPFDLRLTVLRMLSELPLIIGITLLGSLLFGGGYYVKNVLLEGESRYSATSRYRIEYAVEEEKDVGTVYINQMSWNTYLQSEMFLGEARKYLTQMSETAGATEAGGSIDTGSSMETEASREARGSMERGSSMEIGDSELREALEAVVESDLRLLTTVVTTDDPEKSILIAGAVEAALEREFARQIKEIDEIRVIDTGDSASEVVPDVRPERAFALSAVLSCFLSIVILLLKETGDDSIWLPSSLWKRYGLRSAGTPESKEFAENLRYFFPQGMERIALCGCGDGTDLKDVSEKLRQKCPETVGEKWFAAEDDPFGAGVCDRLRQAEGVLLAVQAGRHGGRRLERVLEYLEQQDCRVTAAVLWGADERLIRRYYFCGGDSEARDFDTGKDSI